MRDAAEGINDTLVLLILGNLGGSILNLEQKLDLEAPQRSSVSGRQTRSLFKRRATYTFNGSDNSLGHTSGNTTGSQVGKELGDLVVLFYYGFRHD